MNVSDGGNKSCRHKNCKNQKIYEPPTLSKVSPV